MQWTKPDFQEISLGMEVTAYVNTDNRDDRLERKKEKGKSKKENENE